MTTPMDSRSMKGRLRPRLEWHRSERDPKIGVRKKPMSGDKHHMSVICS